MLEICSKFVSAIFMSISGYVVISNIINENKKINIKDILIIIVMSILITMAYKIKGSNLYSLIIFIINLISYKLIFNYDLEDGIILTTMMTLFAFFLEVIISIIFIVFLDANAIANNNLLLVIINFFIMLLNIFIIELNRIRKIIRQVYYSSTKKKNILNTVFLLLLILEISYTTYSISKNFKLSLLSIVDLMIMIVLIIIMTIYFLEKNKYNKLINEYDILFNNIQNFEDWIEEEQLIRHEYKNQLAIIKTLTKSKKVHQKIDEILNSYINIKEDIIESYRKLPKNGIKGLLYYKTIISQKRGIKTYVDIGNITKTKIKNISAKRMKIISRLIGIYYDNAIEATTEVNNKQILIEIYQLRNNLRIVISNTFNKNTNIENIDCKGVTTKGKGRGNGLYFARKMIFQNKDWVNQNRKIIDNYYIQELTIKLD